MVTADVPDQGIVGRNPARLIRTRLADGDVARLPALAWWDWPVEQLTAHARTIMSGSVDDLERPPGQVSSQPSHCSSGCL